MTDAPLPPETPNPTAQSIPGLDASKIVTGTFSQSAVPQLPSGKFEWSSITKSIVYVLSMIVAVGTPILAYTTDFLPEKVALIISAVVGVSGSILHYLAPNTTTDPIVAQTQSVRLK